MPLEKSLDRKLAAIHADPSGCKEFIIADAKDADMGFSIRSGTMGKCGSKRWLSTASRFAR